jgi:heme-degrading monooxygenase HmoA
MDVITEVASIRVKAGEEPQFEEAARKATDVFRRAEGCLGFAVQRCVEEPGLYQALIHWRTVEDHTVGFRNGPLFQEWRALVGPSFAEPPAVLHFAPLLDAVDFT